MVKLLRPRVINEGVKQYIFDIIRLISLSYYPWYYFRLRKRRNIRLVIGAGAHYVKGWLNLEINPVFRKDIWYDLRNPLPLADNSVSIIYSAHVLEHMFIHDLKRLLHECYRVLKKGGILRICLPCLRKSVRAYIENKTSFFAWNPPELDPFSDRSIAACFSRNVLIDGAHKNMFDAESFRHVLTAVGFTEVVETEYTKSCYMEPAEIAAVEPVTMISRKEHSFVVEARK